MPQPQFDGETYIEEYDFDRLTRQIDRVRAVMLTMRWRTLGEIEGITGDPQASISARIRDLRKDKFGGHNIERRHRGDPTRGHYEYRLVLPEQGEMFE